MFRRLFAASAVAAFLAGFGPAWERGIAEVIVKRADRCLQVEVDGKPVLHDNDAIVPSDSPAEPYFCWAPMVLGRSRSSPANHTSRRIATASSSIPGERSTSSIRATTAS